jgi:hypothetical protein
VETGNDRAVGRAGVVGHAALAEAARLSDVYGETIGGHQATTLDLMDDATIVYTFLHPSLPDPRISVDPEARTPLTEWLRDWRKATPTTVAGIGLARTDRWEGRDKLPPERSERRRLRLLQSNDSSSSSPRAAPAPTGRAGYREIEVGERWPD